VQRKVWATQQHNEEILDQAYRTSKDVFLIFGVNKSGEFYGYSRFVLGWIVVGLPANLTSQTGWQAQSCMAEIVYLGNPVLHLPSHSVHPQ